MQDIVATAGRRKSLRWNTQSKVTGHSVETLWRNRVTAGSVMSSVWQSKCSVTSLVQVKYNVGKHVSSGGRSAWSAAKSVNVNARTLWRDLLITTSSAETGFDVRWTVHEKTSTGWNVLHRVRRSSVSTHRIFTSASLKAKLFFKVFVRPVAVESHWSVRNKVVKKAGTGFHDRKKVSVSSGTDWNLEHNTFRVATSWQVVGRKVTSAILLSNTRITVGKSVKTDWMVKTPVYVASQTRYNCLMGWSGYIPSARPSIARANTGGLVPTTTWNRLTTKQKLRVK